jgi:hypothetical protein
MASTSKYHVYNCRQQGLAETSRLILEYAGAKYENTFVEVLLKLVTAFHRSWITPSYDTGLES